MALETVPFDAAKYLTGAEAIEEYLIAAFETDDAGFITDALGVVARAHGMAQLARDTGLSRQSLYKALTTEGNPEFATVLKIAHALGFHLKPVRTAA